MLRLSTEKLLRSASIIHSRQILHSPSPSLSQLYATTHNFSSYKVPTRPFSSSDDIDDNKGSADLEPELLYEGALASLTLRLKRISVSTCALGLVGLPAVSLLYGIDASATAQAAVGGTAMAAACGSTVALSYCFSPYVHTLEYVPNNSDSDGSTDDSAAPKLIKAVTRNILSMKVETIFDPTTDVIHNTNSRPFCNFIAKGVPMYVHKELIADQKLYVQLLGKPDDADKNDAPKKDDDDGIF